MAPRNAEIVSTTEDDEIKNEVEPVVTAETHGQKAPPMRIVWRNVIWMVWLHSACIIGLYVFPFAHPLTWAWCAVLYLMNALGITAGAHRLWAHRSYKAKLPTRIMLAFFQTLAFQNDIVEWSRDHRAHHKYSETDGDPHNAKRGFFFSHMGWLLVRKHPDVKAKGRLLDVSDLIADPVCAFQRRYYVWLVFATCFGFPTIVPWYFWGESAWTAFHIAGVLRYTVALHVTWCVNSVAHMWGNKPYDQNINPVENFFVTFGAIGEGYHNYHHVFPHDYTTSEFNWKFNPTSIFIDFLAAIGQVTDRKKMSHEMVFRRKQRTGDGTAGFGHLSFKKPVKVNSNESKRE